MSAPELAIYAVSWSPPGEHQRNVIWVRAAHPEAAAGAAEDWWVKQGHEWPSGRGQPVEVVLDDAPGWVAPGKDPETGKPLKEFPEGVIAHRYPMPPRAAAV